MDMTTMDTLTSIEAFRQVIESGNASVTSPRIGRGQRDVRISTRGRRAHGGLRPNDRPLIEGEEPALGSHLVTPRRGYAHHGIYVGGGRVVHYGAFVRPLQRGPVEEVPLARFALGRALWLRRHGDARFDYQDVILRARSRIGEDCYRLLTNNCEHFCEWCLRDVPCSEQVERALVLPRRLARVARAAVAVLFAIHSWAFTRAHSLVREVPSTG
jgi:Lecithin retinol acyltransferase